MAMQQVGDDTTFTGGGPPSLRRSMGTAVLSVGTFLVGAMLTVVIPILPNIASEMAGGNAAFATQVLIAMPMLGLVIGGLVATVVFARFAPRTVFLGGVVLYGIIGSLGYFASMELLIVSRLLMGVVSACIGAASTALIGERVHPDHRPRVLGWAVAASSALGIAAMMMSGWLADGEGWRTSFLVLPGLAAIVFLLTFFLTDPSAVAEPSQAKAQAVGKFDALLMLWPIFLFVVLVNITAFTTNSQSSFVLAADGVASAGGRARFMGINQAMLVVAAFLFPFIRRIVGFRLIPGLILLVMGAGLLLLGSAPNLTMTAVALGLLGLGNGMLFPFQSSLLLQHARPDVRGQAAGLVFSCQFLADALNPLVLGPVILAFGLKETIGAVGIVAIGGAIVAAIVGIRVLRELPPAPAKSSA